MVQILIVEDNPKIANLLRRGLLEERYAVDVAIDGEEALDKEEVNEYDLVILDIMLPKKDGFEVCRTIRSRNTSIPILMLTARGELEDRITGLDSGADDYLTKPFAFGELTARIRALLRRGNVAEPAILTLSDLTLNPATREVRRGDAQINCTAREYALLEYLLRNQGRPLSKAQIIEHVWDYSYDGASNIVETYVKYLRKKLQVSANDLQLIHTVRGHGYVMKQLGGHV
jgi:DNA-binding response OmpR family regulator